MRRFILAGVLCCMWTPFPLTGIAQSPATNASAVVVQSLDVLPPHGATYKYVVTENVMATNKQAFTASDTVQISADPVKGYTATIAGGTAPQTIALKQSGPTGINIDAPLPGVTKWAQDINAVFSLFMATAVSLSPGAAWVSEPTFDFTGVLVPDMHRQNRSIPAAFPLMVRVQDWNSMLAVHGEGGALSGGLTRAVYGNAQQIARRLNVSDSRVGAVVVADFKNTSLVHAEGVVTSGVPDDEVPARTAFHRIRQWRIDVIRE